MRKLVAAVVVLATASIAVVLLTPEAVDEAIGSDEPTSASDQSVAIETDQATRTEMPDSVRPATAVKLADGDSFDIVWSDTDEYDEVRLLGINAPEADACFGSQARSALDDLIDDKTLFIDGVQRDDFGRVLAEVWVDDVFVNATMVRRGAALSLSNDGNHATVIARAQAAAESELLGLWSPDACGSAVSVVAIATIRSDAAGPDNENQNDEWIEIENVAEVDVDLSGWAIRDESTRNRFSFPGGYVLGAGQTVRVRSGCGSDESDNLYWCARDPVWNNGGDTGFLVDPEGRFADTFAY